MAKERDDRKKEKKEKKLRKAEEELKAKKKISKKQTKELEKSKKKSKKSNSNVEEKPRKKSKKSKKSDTDEEEEPRKKSMESKKKKHKTSESDSDEDEEPPKESKESKKKKHKRSESDSDEEEEPRKESKQSKKKKHKRSEESDSDEEEEPPKELKVSKKKKHKRSEESDSDEEEEPRKESKESKKKKPKRSEESDDDEPPHAQIVRSHDSHPVTIPVATNESDSDDEFDKEDIKHLVESYSKEELINLIYKTAEKGSRLVSAVLESANRDTTKRNIFVRGLGWDTTQENLKEAFQVYGEIEECSVVMDKDTGKAKGYGFVMFRTLKGAKKALKIPEKRMYNRTLICNLAKPSGALKPREPVESVKIDLTHTAGQSELALPWLDLGHGHSNGVDKGHPHQNMPMYAGQNMPFYGPPPGYNPMMYGAMMGNQMVAGLPNYHMFGTGMANQGPPNHMGMVGTYVGEGNGVPSFDDERAWYLR